MTKTAFYTNIKKSHLSTFFFIFCIVVIGEVTPFTSCATKNKLKTQTLIITRIDNTTSTLKTEIARTEREKEYGFMNRKNIPEGTGMLFVYDKDIHLSFWMKNTPLPLSIAYINSRGVIKELHNMTPYSLNPIVGDFACRYALEVPQGWFKANNITVNSKINVNIL